MLPKRILVCTDSKQSSKRLLDDIHTWLNLDPRGFVVTRADGLIRAQYQVRTQEEFDLIIAYMDDIESCEWLALLQQEHKRILYILDYRDSTRHFLLKKDLTKVTLLAKVAKLLKL
jgi:hypothetical protein